MTIEAPNTPGPTQAIVRVVAGAIVRDGHVLAAQRPVDHHLSLLWEFPGGKVDPGESDAQALHRELQEELDVDVRVGDHFGDTLHAWHRGVLHLVGYVCELRTGEPAAIEHNALRWINIQDVDTLRWAPADIPLVQALKAHLAADRPRTITRPHGAIAAPTVRPS